MFKRIYFRKIEDMQYLSHRDFLRFLERLFKISKVPILYSKGFHPRPKMSFGNPISIGEEAFYEPFDIELKENIDNKELIDKLNLKSPKGFELIEAKDIDGRTSIISSFNACLYELEFEFINDLENILQILSQEKVMEEREKNGVKKIRDLKVNVISYENKGENKLEMILSSISPNAFIRIANIDQKFIKIKRIKYLNI